MAEYNSKKVASKLPAEYIYNKLIDIRGMAQAIPEEKKKDITFTEDTISTSYAGFNLAVRLSRKEPCTLVELSDIEAPFHFCVAFHLDEDKAGASGCNVSVNVNAELNFMMKTLLGGKIQEAVDNIALSLATGVPFQPSF